MSCGFLILTQADTTGVSLDVPVALGGARRSVDHTIGEMSRAFAGVGRNTVQSTKSRWEVTTVPMDATATAALRSFVVPGSLYEVTGVVLGVTAALDCYVSVDAEHYIAAAGGVLVEFTLTIRER